MKKFKVFIYHNLNAPKAICNHMLGADHKPVHRISVGIVIMVFGVVVAKGAALAEPTFIHIAGDAFGYFLHALGSIPLLKLIDREKKEDTDG